MKWQNILTYGIVMDDEEFSYKTLRKIQQAEKQSATITQIPKTFYEEFHTFRTSLQNQLETESKQKRQMLLADEIQSIDKIMTSIYELREKKIMMAAMTRIRGGTPSIKDLLDSELQLFESLQTLLQATRRSVLSQENQADVTVTEENTSDANQEQDTPQSVTEEHPKETPVIGQDSTVLRIIKDMPTFVGTDAKQYLIKEDDIISVPAKMGEMLLKRHIAEKIELRT